MRNVSRLCLCAHHALEVEAVAWLKGGSRVCDQCPPGEDEHVQDEAHTLILPRPLGM